LFKPGIKYSNRWVLGHSLSVTMGHSSALLTLTAESWIISCSIKQITVEEIYGVELYLHAFITTVLDGDMPFISTSDRNFSAVRKKVHNEMRLG
jgi:hypothetical protein